MISYLDGTVTAIEHQVLTITVHGVGFAVSVADERVFSVGQTIKLSIYFHWNQENGPQLFGFTDSTARSVFTLIISCSGIGPKMGLALLAQMSPEQFLQAIALADTKALSSVSGIGPKKAEVMIMHLKDKVAKMPVNQTKSPESATLNKLKDLNQALTSLNYSRPEITGALDYLKKNYTLETSSFDELLRKSLSFLAKKT